MITLHFITCEVFLLLGLQFTGFYFSTFPSVVGIKEKHGIPGRGRARKDLQ